MDIMVYWSVTGEKNGALERLEAPYSAAWADWLVQIEHDDEGYFVGVKSVDGNNTSIRLAPYHTSQINNYMDWLEENVDAIQVNGYPWWTSSRTKQESDG